LPWVLTLDIDSETLESKTLLFKKLHLLKTNGLPQLRQATISPPSILNSLEKFSEVGPQKKVSSTLIVNYHLWSGLLVLSTMPLKISHFTRVVGLSSFKDLPHLIGESTLVSIGHSAHSL